MDSLTGNIIVPGKAGFGKITWNGEKIISVDLSDEVRQNEPWILPAKYDVTPYDAALMTSSNPAKCLKLDHRTGSLKPGMDADITVLAPDQLTVLKTITRGAIAYEIQF